MQLQAIDSLSVVGYTIHGVLFKGILRGKSQDLGDSYYPWVVRLCLLNTSNELTEYVWIDTSFLRDAIRWLGTEF